MTVLYPKTLVRILVTYSTGVLGRGLHQKCEPVFNHDIHCIFCCKEYALRCRIGVLSVGAASVIVTIIIIMNFNNQVRNLDLVHGVPLF
jgi:hypothetical protein